MAWIREFQIQALTDLKTMWEGAPNVLSDHLSEKVIPWEPVFRFLEGCGLGLSKEDEWRTRCN